MCIINATCSGGGVNGLGVCVCVATIFCGCIIYRLRQADGEVKLQNEAHCVWNRITSQSPPGQTCGPIEEEDTCNNSRGFVQYAKHNTQQTGACILCVCSLGAWILRAYTCSWLAQ